MREIDPGVDDGHIDADAAGPVTRASRAELGVDAVDPGRQCRRRPPTNAELSVTMYAPRDLGRDGRARREPAQHQAGARNRDQRGTWTWHSCLPRFPARAGADGDRLAVKGRRQPGRAPCFLQSAATASATAATKASNGRLTRSARTSSSMSRPKPASSLCRAGGDPLAGSRAARGRGAQSPVQLRVASSSPSEISPSSASSGVSCSRRRTGRSRCSQRSSAARAPSPGGSVEKTRGRPGGAGVLPVMPHGLGLPFPGAPIDDDLDVWIAPIVGAERHQQLLRERLGHQAVKRSVRAWPLRSGSRRGVGRVSGHGSRDRRDHLSVIGYA